MNTSISGRAKRFIRSPKLSDWFCGPTSLLFNGYQGKFPEVQVAEACG
jgi:hypothetical protein